MTDLRVGECSYKVFLDIGGEPKKKSDPWPDNDFPDLLRAMPTFERLGAAASEHGGQSPRPRGLHRDAGANRRQVHQGASGVNAFNTWVAKNRKDAPPSMTDAIIIALHKYGYSAATTGRYRDAQALD